MKNLFTAEATIKKNVS